MPSPPLEIRQRSFLLDGRELPYRLERRRGRRRLTLQVEPRQGLRVLAPPRLPLRDVDAFLNQQRDWLRQELAALAEWEAAHPLRRFENGDSLPLLGEAWRLEIREQAGRRRPRVERRPAESGAGSIVLILPAGLAVTDRRELARRSLDRWYRRLAAQLLDARLRHWQARLGVECQRLSIRDTRSLWGSCASNGRITLNWKIVMAPPAVVDYLVVHELCHLREANHSARFWELVADQLPDYARVRRWLRRRGRELYL